MRLEIGMRIKTSYDSGPYYIESITRHCTCPSYLDQINGNEEPSQPHIHLSVRDEQGRGGYYLNGYDEETLKSVWDDDYLIILEGSQIIQQTLNF